MASRFAFGRLALVLLVLLCEVFAVIDIPLVRRDVKLAGRKRSDILLDLGYGEYLATLNVGASKKSNLAIVDTGSIVTYLKEGLSSSSAQQCPSCCSCKSCVKDSSSCQSCDSTCYLCGMFCSSGTSCASYTQYGDSSSVEGNVVRESVFFDGLESMTFNASLVAITKSSSTFAPSPITGIIGINSAACSIWSNLQRSYNIDDVFSFYMTDAGGVFTIGGSNSKYYTGSIMKEPMRDCSIFYCMRLNSISIGSKKVSSKQLFIVDSGTPLTRIESDLYSSLHDVLPSVFPYDGEKHSVNLADLPPITFNFDNVSLTIQPSQYLIVSSKTYQSTFLSSDSYNILGTYFTKHFYTIYDNKNKVFGFANLRSSPTATQAPTSTSTGSKSSSSNVTPALSVLLLCFVAVLGLALP